MFKLKTLGWLLNITITYERVLNQFTHSLKNVQELLSSEVCASQCICYLPPPTPTPTPHLCVASTVDTDTFFKNIIKVPKLVFKGYVSNNFTYCLIVWFFCGKQNNDKVMKTELWQRAVPRVTSMLSNWRSFVSSDCIFYWHFKYLAHYRTITTC